VDLQIRGKRAFVSGSSSGIGKAIALELAKEGCDVAVHGRDKVRTEETAHEVAELGVRSIAALGDLATEGGCDLVARETLAAFGTVDIVVNNAGVALLKHDPRWSEIPLETWIDSFQVNFMSTLRMSRHFLPGIERSGWGRFINISTGGATTTPSLTEYTAAKAALNKLTADMAKDVGRVGATANGIAPGVVLTPAVEEWLRLIARQRNWPGDMPEWEQRFISEMAPQQAVKRFSRPQDIAAPAAFFASPRAAHISGVTIRVDSGHNSAVYL
jgi:NAD(P)-dependent dehydrogenase (short-subunit alcohol dehydrogenase family)